MRRFLYALVIKQDLLMRISLRRYSLIIITRLHWKNLLIVSIVWFIYDCSVFAFDTYSSIWLDVILAKSAPPWKVFGWNVVNLFYLPVSFAGAFVSDWIGS